MADISWTMNCILFGAEIMDLIKANKDEEAITKIRSLTSEFDDATAEYLLMRLKEIKN